MGRLAVLRILADGERHSGEAIAAALGVSRSAVWKQVQALTAWGLEVSAAAGQGYRLAAPLELLEPERLTQQLASASRAATESLKVFHELDSTNAYLLGQPAPAPGRLAVALAEFQTAGRGRRGRAWSTPFGGGVMLSTGWRFARPPPTLAALSLAIGVAARAAIARVGVEEVTLKWPNDLVWRDGKLGGILVEVNGDAQGPCYVVAGIGVNVCLSPRTRACIEHAWGRGPVDLTEAGGGRPPSRNRLAAALIDGVHEVLAGYEAGGFAPYRDRWRAADALAGRLVHATASDGEVIGRAAGVDADGALLVATAAGTRP